MNKTVLLAATAVLALTAGGAMAASHHPGVAVKATSVRPIQSPGGTLYNQNSNYGYGIDSQNFSATYSKTYDSAAADDFAVPAGKTWKVTGVDAAGVYYNGSGPASSEVVTFYKKAKGGHPGTIIKQQTVNCTDSGGSFACKLPSAVKLNNSTGTKKK